MRIDQITGIFNCFSCGYKGNLFNHFGERANQLQQQRDLFKKKIIQKNNILLGKSNLDITNSILEILDQKKKKIDLK